MVYGLWFLQEPEDLVRIDTFGDADVLAAGVP